MRKVCYLLAALVAFPVHAQTAFDNWMAGFRQEALAQGISPATLDAALTGITPVEKVVELDQRQPEFLQTFIEYLDKRVTPARIARGQALLQEHAALLDEVEQKYGVPRTILVSFWGLETNFGSTLGSHNIPASLATLAFDGRRSTFFRNQLLDALRIIDAGHVQAIDMNGSWAGAMGHMQFMPSTYRAYAVDGDGDGRINLWQSVPDAMHSAGNYLKRAGWRAQEPAALEVSLPANFDWRYARVNNRLAVSEWSGLGVQKIDGTALPSVAGNAAIILPQGWQGPALIVFDNFDVIMKWNRSVNYALSVAQLAQQMAGTSALAVRSGEANALSMAQLKVMQQSLNELGLDAGTPDGMLGPRTQNAIRLYQVMHHLPADGYPAPSVLMHIVQSHYLAQLAGKLTSAPITFSEQP